MSQPITSGLQSIVYPVSDLEAATTVYAALLGEPHTDTPYYVGFNVGGTEVGLNPNGQTDSPSGMWAVADVAAAVSALEEAGGTCVFGPQDVGGGTTIAHVVDGDGNAIGLIHAQVS